MRLDFFGDTLEIDPQLSIRRRSARTEQLRALDLVPVARSPAHGRDDPPLPRAAMSRRSARRRRDDPLYEAVSEGRRYPGMEHWLPLFHERLETLFDYVPARRLCSSRWPRRPRASGFEQIADYYEARARGAATPARRALQAAAAGPALSSPKTNGKAGSTMRRWRG